MSTRLTEASLARLEKLEAKATPGEWKVSESGVYIDAADGMVAEMENCPEFKSNSEFIAALRNHAPALIAAARRDAALERVVEAARRQQEAFSVYCDAVMCGEEYRAEADKAGLPTKREAWKAACDACRALDEALAALDAAGKEVQGC